MSAIPKVSIVLLSSLFLFLAIGPLVHAPEGDETSPYMVVSTDKDAYYLGEPIVVNITLVNPTTDHYEYGFPSSCHYDISFYNLSDDLVYAPHWICAAILTSIHLDPHESYMIGQYVWNQTVRRYEKVEDRWVVFYDPAFSDGYRIVVELSGHDISDEEVIEIVGPPPPPPKKALRGEILAPAHIISGDTVAVVISVRDEYGDPVQGANVSVNPNLGKLTPASGSTDANGRFLASFEPPEVENNNSVAVFIMITDLSKEGHVTDYQSYAIIWVYPAHTKVLSLSVLSFAGDVVKEGDQTAFLIEVRDGSQSPVSDVTFNVSSDSEYLQLEISPMEEVGKYRLQIATPEVRDDTTFLVQIYASKSEYLGGFEAFEIVVLDVEEEETGVSELLLYTVGFSVAAFAGGILAGHLIATRKRKK
jgi:hypothetical protein